MVRKQYPVLELANHMPVRIWIWPEPLIAPRVRRALGTRMSYVAKKVCHVFCPKPIQILNIKFALALALCTFSVSHPNELRRVIIIKSFNIGINSMVSSEIWI
jgi:hypothetical protein